MKKIILSAVAVMVFSFANAQETKFGVKGALNIANFSGDIDNTSALVGFNVGGFVEIKISEKLSVQPELLFSTQGAKYKESEPFYSFESKSHLSYVNVPVMAKFYVAKQFSLEAGPQIGFLISAKGDVSETSNGSNVKLDGVDVKDEFESVDFGLNFGAGYDFTENLSAGLRYNFGLSNIVKDADDDYKVSNNVISVSLGYKF